ncbi:MAG: hypothetical protein LN589_01385 [Rickettsia endosymbiont of Eriopis connexa]|nr:hypothetical protein [Rickettsia endosymbiont of Eriopis connexa]
MLNTAREFLGKDIDIAILAAPQNIQKNLSYTKKFDFIYPASGESHKNHINLLKAWIILADIGIKSSLALTINTELYTQKRKKNTRIYTKISTEYS